MSAKAVNKKLGRDNHDWTRTRKAKDRTRRLTVARELKKLSQEWDSVRLFGTTAGATEN